MFGEKEIALSQTETCKREDHIIIVRTLSGRDDVFLLAEGRCWCCMVVEDRNGYNCFIFGCLESNYSTLQHCHRISSELYIELRM